MFLGIEIGGTKLQLGVGRGDGEVLALWRAPAKTDGDGIRQPIVAALPELLAKVNLPRDDLRGVGVGFGGPTDDATQSVVKSHHVEGWHGFPLAAWLSELTGLPTVICNDADVAGLAEAQFGAGRGLSPIFYITVGTGIGGGLIIDGAIYRGVGKGACEIGHLLVPNPANPTELVILEAVAAGWGIEARAGTGATARAIGDAAKQLDPVCSKLIDEATSALALAIRQMITLLCPRRVVIGGGVSLIGEELFFAPLRRKVQERRFEAFAGLTDIVRVALEEEVVIHGALALARQKLGG